VIRQRAGLSSSAGEGVARSAHYRMLIEVLAQLLDPKFVVELESTTPGMSNGCPCTSTFLDALPNHHAVAVGRPTS